MGVTLSSLTTGSGTTLSYTVPSSTQMLVVVLAHEGANITETPSLSYGGVPMALRVARTTITATTGNEQGCAIFTLANPAAGTANLVPTGWSNANTLLAAFCANGLDVTTPIGDTGEGSRGGAPGTIAFNGSDAETAAGESLVTVGAGSLIVAALTNGDTGQTTAPLGGTWTRLTKFDGPSGDLTVDYLPDAGGVGTSYGATTWTTSPSLRPVTVQLELRAALGAADETVTNGGAPVTNEGEVVTHAPTASAAGSAAGVATATGVGASRAKAAGQADGTSTASALAPGSSTASGAGLASGSSTAVAIGSTGGTTIVSAVGLAEGSSTASAVSTAAPPVEPPVAGGRGGGGGSGGAYEARRTYESAKREKEEALWKGRPGKVGADKDKRPSKDSAEVKKTLTPRPEPTGPTFEDLLAEVMLDPTPLPVPLAPLPVHKPPAPPVIEPEDDLIALLFDL